MSDFANTIKKIRLSRGMSLEEFAKLLGSSKQNISRYENGQVSPKVSTAQKIADKLGISLTELNGGDPADVTGVQKIPVLGTIPAGIPLEAIEDIIDWEEIPADWTRCGKEYFALQVHGRSMYPRYEEGDILILRKQETCESGQDCAVMVNGNDATFKRVKRTEEGVLLQALNPECESYFYSNQQVIDLPVRILGVVVELRRKI